MQGVGEVTLLPEPVAVGEQRAAEADIEAGSTLAVYSLGDGVFGASVIRRVATGAFLLLTRTESMDQLGGARFTDLLLGQVRGSLGQPMPDLDLDDPQARGALFRLRQACAQAKEQLSTEPEVIVPVSLPGVQTQIRVTRGSFDELIRTTVTCTVDLLLRTIRAAALAPAQIDAVLLVGGSSRVPLIAELVASGLASKDTVIVQDEAPELTPVKGAALAARRLATGKPSPIAAAAAVHLTGGQPPAATHPSSCRPAEANRTSSTHATRWPRSTSHRWTCPNRGRSAASCPWVSPSVLGVIVTVARDRRRGTHVHDRRRHGEQARAAEQLGRGRHHCRALHRFHRIQPRRRQLIHSTATTAELIVDEQTRAVLAEITHDPMAATRLVVIAPGGHGKTALLAELEHTYRAAGLTVLGPREAGAAPADADTVLIVDDAHHLAPAQLDELSALVDGELPRAVVACRPWPRSAELAGLAERLTRRRGPLLLAPFDQRQTAAALTAALGRTPGPALVERVQRLTGGVPRFVERVAASLDPTIKAPDQEIPATALAAFGYDFDRLEPEVLRFLLAQLAGVGAHAELVGELLGRDPDGVAAIVEAAKASGLLAADGTLVPIVAAALATLNPGEGALAVRARLAQLQLARGGAVLELVRPLPRSGVAGLAAAYEAAADEALASEPALAAELFGAAVSCGAPLASVAVRWAGAAALAGDLPAALRLTDQVIAGPPAPDQAEGASIAATALVHLGQLGSAAELYKWSGAGPAMAFAAISTLGTGALDDADRTVRRGRAGRSADPADQRGIADGQRHPGVGHRFAAGRARHAGPRRRAARTRRQVRAAAGQSGRARRAGRVALRRAEHRRVRVGPRGRGERRRRADAGPAPVVAGLDLHDARRVRGRAGIPGHGQQGLRPPTSQGTGSTRSVSRSGSRGAAATWPRCAGSGRRRATRSCATRSTSTRSCRSASSPSPPPRLRDQDRLAPHVQEAKLLAEQLRHPPLWTTAVHWSGLHAAIIGEEPAVAEEHVHALADGAGHSRYGAVLYSAARCWLAVVTGNVHPGSVESAARELDEVGLSWDGARLAGQAAIRTSDRKAMVRLLECARLLQGKTQVKPAHAKAVAAKENTASSTAARPR